MPRAIRLHSFGGPEVLQLEEVEVAAPARGEVRIHQTAVGLNFIDVYGRNGLYPVPLPAGLGKEAAGVVVATGPGVKDLKEGDRVAYVYSQPGAYADERVMPADRVVRIPQGVSDREAAAAMLKGLGATDKTLVIDVHPDDNFATSVRNIAGVRLVPSARVTARDVADAERVIATRAAVERLQEVLA